MLLTTSIHKVKTKNRISDVINDKVCVRFLGFLFSFYSSRGVNGHVTLDKEEDWTKVKNRSRRHVKEGSKRRKLIRWDTIKIIMGDRLSRNMISSFFIIEFLDKCGAREFIIFSKVMET